MFVSVWYKVCLSFCLPTSFALGGSYYSGSIIFPHHNSLLLLYGIGTLAKDYYIMDGTLNIGISTCGIGKSLIFFNLLIHQQNSNAILIKILWWIIKLKIIRPFSIPQVDRFPSMGLNSALSISEDVPVLAVSQSSLFYAMKVYWTDVHGV